MKRFFLVVVCALAFLSTGCIGPNNAFNSLHSWNSRATGSKWGNEGVHILMWIAPYPLALMGDLLIFNSIEFWGGDNPIEAPEPFTPVGDAVGG